MYKNYTAGVMYAFMSSIVGHPFDFVKAQQQSGMYKNSLYCVKNVVRLHGPIGLYKGVVPPLISHMIKRPYQYTLAEYLKNHYNFGAYNNFIVGSITNSTSALLCNPLQVVKVGMETSLNKSTTLQYTYYIFKKNGLKGFYKGIVPTFIKETLFGSIYFGLYYNLRDKYGSSNILNTFLYSAGSSSIAWMFIMPIDNIKTNMQKDINSLSSIRNTFIYIYSTYNIKGFWNGITPSLAKTIPMAGLSMICYEYIRKII